MNKQPMMTQSHDYVVCPYCDHEHSDAHDWCKSGVLTETCEGCGRQFRCWAEYDVTFIAKPV